MTEKFLSTMEISKEAVKRGLTLQRPKRINWPLFGVNLFMAVGIRVGEGLFADQPVKYLIAGALIAAAIASKNFFSDAKDRKPDESRAK